MSSYADFPSAKDIKTGNKSKVQQIHDKIAHAISRGKNRIIVEAINFPEDADSFIQALRSKKYEVEIFGCEECVMCNDCKSYVIRWE